MLADTKIQKEPKSPKLNGANPSYRHRAGSSLIEWLFKQVYFVLMMVCLWILGGIVCKITDTPSLRILLVVLIVLPVTLIFPLILTYILYFLYELCACYISSQSEHNNKKVSNIAKTRAQKHESKNNLSEKKTHHLIKNSPSPAVKGNTQKHSDSNILYKKARLRLIKNVSTPAIQDSIEKHDGPNVLCEKGGHRLIKDGHSLKVEKTVKMNSLYYIRIIIFTVLIVGILVLLGFYGFGSVLTDLLYGEVNFSEAVPAITLFLIAVFMLVCWPYAMFEFFTKAIVLNKQNKFFEISRLLFGRQRLKKKITSPHAILVKPAKNWDPKKPIYWGCRIWLITSYGKSFILGTSCLWPFPTEAMNEGQELGEHIADFMDIPLRLEGWKRLGWGCKDKADARRSNRIESIFSSLKMPVVTKNNAQIKPKVYSKDAKALDIPMVDCPYCDTHVLLMSDGRCPNCKKLINEEI